MKGKFTTLESNSDSRWKISGELGGGQVGERAVGRFKGFEGWEPERERKLTSL